MPQYKLFIAGKNDTAYAARIREEIQALGLSDRVQLVGVIPEEDKYMLYESCVAFLFPSITEGFGLPVIEAMSFGTPVFLYGVSL
ncbi:MAG: glycosyltransferase [Pseudomonadales bacterium]|nr:glycosyltransferase [Pseudomonadales bacterium]